MAPASLVTSVPVIPIATPMSADFSAGASLTPSPVIATTCRSAWSASTTRSLCSGATRAYTWVVRAASVRAAASARSSWAPVTTTASPSPPMPRSAAMRAAVTGWSPVIMTVRMPARRASAIAAAASARGGSRRATSPPKVRSRSAGSPNSSASPAAAARQAIPRVR